MHPVAWLLAWEVTKSGYRYWGPGFLLHLNGFPNVGTPTSVASVRNELFALGGKDRYRLVNGLVCFACFISRGLSPLLDASCRRCAVPQTRDPHFRGSLVLPSASAHKMFAQLKDKLNEKLAAASLALTGDESDKQISELVARATSEELIAPDWALNMTLIDTINQTPNPR